MLQFPLPTCFKTLSFNIRTAFSLFLSLSWRRTAIWLTPSNVEKRLSLDWRERILPSRRNFISRTKLLNRMHQRTRHKRYCPRVAKWYLIHPRLRCNEYNRGPSGRVDKLAEACSLPFVETFNYITSRGKKNPFHRKRDDDMEATWNYIVSPLNSAWNMIMGIHRLVIKIVCKTKSTRRRKLKTPIWA